MDEALKDEHSIFVTGHKCKISARELALSIELLVSLPLVINLAIALDLSSSLDQ